MPPHVHTGRQPAAPPPATPTQHHVHMRHTPLTSTRSVLTPPPTETPGKVTLAISPLPPSNTSSTTRYVGLQGGVQFLVIRWVWPGALVLLQWVGLWVLLQWVGLWMLLQQRVELWVLLQQWVELWVLLQQWVGLWVLLQQWVELWVLLQWVGLL